MEELLDTDTLEKHLSRSKYKKRKGTSSSSSSSSSTKPKKRRKANTESKKLIKRIRCQQETPSLHVKNREKETNFKTSNKYPLRIQNIVCSFSTDIQWNPETILQKLKDITLGNYDKLQFAAAKITLGGRGHFRVTFSVYQSSECVTTGAVSPASVVLACRRLVYMLRQFDPLRRRIHIKDLTIANIVASIGLGIEDQIDLANTERVMESSDPGAWVYSRPSTFPSLKVREKARTRSMLIFKTGKKTYVGIGSYEEFIKIKESEEQLHRLLENCKKEDKKEEEVVIIEEGEQKDLLSNVLESILLEDDKAIKPKPKPLSIPVPDPAPIPTPIPIPNPDDNNPLLNFQLPPSYLVQ